jgi:hypothetical protein
MAIGDSRNPWEATASPMLHHSQHQDTDLAESYAYPR